jgi:mRNA-degrading endonuclease RelE of RelBE toxin-antitoxin system
VVEVLIYKIIIERKAEKDAARIPSHLRTAIDKAILDLSRSPRLRGCKKLTEKKVIESA